MKKNKLVIIIVLLIMIYGIGTTVLILFTNRSNNEINNTTKKLVFNNDNFSTVNLTDTYNKNDIEFVDNKHEKEDGIDYDYQIISGLKEKKVQDKVNAQIDKAADKFTKMVHDGEFEEYPRKEYLTEKKDITYESSTISSRVVGNFSNILSIELSLEAYYTYDNKEHDLTYYSDIINVNINLIDGEEVTLADIFKTENDLKNVVTAEAYNSLYQEIGFRCQYYYGIEECENHKPDYSKVDDYVLDALHEIEHGNHKLKLSYDYLYIYVDGMNIELPSYNYIDNTIEETAVNSERLIIGFELLDYYDSIILFDKYKIDKSIYETEAENNHGLRLFTEEKTNADSILNRETDKDVMDIVYNDIFAYDSSEEDYEYYDDMHFDKKEIETKK